jgi:rfaE bifunctional protein nucleotidyltransferase chain/domain/rfaE bifunctional protein kinase chain/domain
MSASIVVIGDALLDRDLDGCVQRLAPDAPVPVVDLESEQIRPGGAALAAAFARRLADVTLITALGRDGAGREVRDLLAAAGVDVVDAGVGGATPEKIRVRAQGMPVARVDRGEGVSLGPLSPGARRAMQRADAVLVSDYGRGITAHSEVQALVADAVRQMSVVWDPHPNGTPPAAAVHLVTPNLSELLGSTAQQPSLATVTTRAREYTARVSCRAVAVTMGERGALLVDGDDPPLVVAADRTFGTDVCGAGDAFAAAATVALAGGRVLSEAVEDAVRTATRFITAGGAFAFGNALTSRTAHDAASPPVNDLSAAAVLERSRARGGSTVATGGCFDLLHAGHVAMLRAARDLGDCLVVLLNSDASVTRLKGRDRPLQTAVDRAEVLHALDCVDAVEIFDEDTPVDALRRLRPDIFAKGGDYAIGELPEAAVIAEWGGQAVLLPYRVGHSTTRLLEEAARHGHR